MTQILLWALQVLRDRAVEQKKAHRHAVWIVIARKDDGFMECRKVFFLKAGAKIYAILRPLMR
ncbi:MAG: hypothetical protein AB8Z26_01470 [Coxiella-like endosymbiont]